MRRRRTIAKPVMATNEWYRHNKIDLVDSAAETLQIRPQIFDVSSTTGAGVDPLLAALADLRPILSARASPLW